MRRIGGSLVAAAVAFLFGTGIVALAEMTTRPPERRSAEMEAILVATDCGLLQHAAEFADERQVRLVAALRYWGQCQ